MDLATRLRDATIEALRGIDVTNLNFHARKYEEVINFLYNRKIIDNNSMATALEEAVIRQAKKDYEFLIRPETYVAPDHVARPGCLAYAIQKGIFSEKELSRIKFDHGDNAETFSKSYSPDKLIPGLISQILKPTPVPKFIGNDSDCHCL
jgi:hypothetical protein